MLMAVLKAKEEITLGNKFVVIHSFLSSVNNLICSGPILVTLMEASDLWLSWIMGCESGTFSSWKNITGNYKIQDGGLSYCSNSQDMVSWGLLWVMQGSPLDLNNSFKCWESTQRWVLSRAGHDLGSGSGDSICGQTQAGRKILCGCLSFVACLLREKGWHLEKKIHAYSWGGVLRWAGMWGNRKTVFGVMWDRVMWVQCHMGKRVTHRDFAGAKIVFAKRSWCSIAVNRLNS